jgi:hypothetical protein
MMSKVSKSKSKSKSVEVENKVEVECQEEKKVSTFFKTSKKKEDKKDAKSSLDTSFVLKDINIVNLDRSYGMKDLQDYIYKNASKTNSVDNKTTTKLLNSAPKNDLKSITSKLENLGFSEKLAEPFETIVRGNTKCNLFTTFNNKNYILQNKENYNCWYCRHSLPTDVLPLSIPIKYYPAYSECSLVHNSLINTVSKLEYKLNTDLQIANVKDKDKIFYERFALSSQDCNKFDSSVDNNKTIDNNDYFDGEGIFCSFNCMVGFISENNCIKYKNTGILINKLYYKLFGFFPKHKILPAPSWRLLKSYGGDLTIDEYRNSFQTVDFSNAWQYTKLLPNSPVSEIFIENKLDNIFSIKK